MEQLMIQPARSKVKEVELVYKAKVKASERPLIKTSKDSYQTLLNMWDESMMVTREIKIWINNYTGKGD